LKIYDTYIVRIGSNKLVFDVLWEQKIILVHPIGAREKAYK